MAVSPTSGHAGSQRELRSDGLLVTLGMLIAIDVLTRKVFRVPTPGAILLLPVAYAAFTGGLRTGLISATIVFLFALYFFAVPSQFLQYTDGNLQTIIAITTIGGTTCPATTGCTRSAMPVAKPRNDPGKNSRS